MGVNTFRDCAIIIRRGTEKPDGGALSKKNAKIGGAGLKLKLLVLQGGGANFHFMSCAFALNCKLKQFHMHCKTGNVLSMLNVLRKCEVYIKKNVITF